jgi:hypothetical protein
MLAAATWPPKRELTTDIGSQSADVVACLSQMLKDQHATVCQTSADSLSRFSAPAAPAVAALTAVLSADQ